MYISSNILHPGVVKCLSQYDKYRLNNSTAMVFLPTDIKSALYVGMNKNRLNEHLMLGSLLKNIMGEERSDILDSLDKETTSIMVDYLNSKVLDYVSTEYPNYLEEFPENFI